MTNVRGNRPTSDPFPAWAETFSEAPWIDGKRVMVYSRFFVGVYAAAVLVVLLLSSGSIDPMGRPVGTDFLCIWTAGKLALQGQASDPYDYRLQFAGEQKALPWKEGQKAPLLPWLYPPIFLLVAKPLALLPYLGALAAWMAATLAVYLACIHRILPGRQAILAALAFPAVFSNLNHGQNGFLTAGLLGGALILLERRPWLSGVLFGLLAYKPQFAILVPLALLAGRHWRSMLGAAATASGMIAVSWAMFGGDAWRAFFETADTARIYQIEQGAAGWETMQSIFAAARLVGAGIPLAYMAQIGFAVIAAASVVWLWRRPAAMALRGAALTTAILMATPYVLDYDLVVLALPIAWIAGMGIREGFLPWEKITLLAAWLLPLVSRRLGGSLHLPVAPLVMMLLMGLIVRRAGRPAHLRL